jgi:uncharacterized membrane protein YphA (DoxX/SURF4 family)
MFAATVAVSVLLALALLGSGSAKLSKQPKIVEQLTGLGVPVGWLPPLALAEFAGAIGLLVGLKVWALGVAAAIGVFLYFDGAVITHVRAKDKNLVPPMVLGLLAVAAGVLRVATR